MNIFVLDRNINKAVEYHCDKHVVKMILESVQMLATVAHHYGYETRYKPTHFKHPCTQWAAASRNNFVWLATFAKALNEEYKVRYDKDVDHKSIEVLKDILDNGDLFKWAWPAIEYTEFAQAMPEQYRGEDVVEAYRRYYIGEKLGFAKWTKRDTPEWVDQSLIGE